MFLLPPLFEPRQRERGNQICGGGDQCLKKGDRKVIDPKEQRCDGVCEKSDEPSAREAYLPCFIDFHAFVAFQNHLNIGIRVGHEEILLHNFPIGM